MWKVIFDNAYLYSVLLYKQGTNDCRCSQKGLFWYELLLSDTYLEPI